MQGSKRDTDVKNRLLDYMGEGKCGMISENSTETCILPYVKQMASASLMHEAGHPKLVLWGNPEGQGGEGAASRVQGRGTHVYLRLIHDEGGQKHHNVVK